MKYPSVYRAHIVPKGYLRGFANNDKIAVRKGRASASVEIRAVDKVGWRKRFYERTRPKTGEKISDVEWSLSHIEDKSPPVLRALDDLWPLDVERSNALVIRFRVSA